MRNVLYLLMIFCVSLLQAQDFHVSPEGNDSYDGSAANPKASLASALRQAREYRRLNGNEQSIRILVHPGKYQLSETIVLRPEDSGTETHPLVIEGLTTTHDAPVISGGMKISGWKKSGKLWVASVPDFNGRPLEFRQLWVNNRKAVRARNIRDPEDMHRILSVDNQQKIIWVPKAAVQGILKAPYPEMVLHQMWAISVLRIRDIEIQGDSAALRFHMPEEQLQFDRPWPRPVVAPGKNSAFYLTNAPALLDEPSEWYYDIRQQRLWYYPLPGEDMLTAEVIAPALDRLVQVEGSLDNPVQHVIFNNLQFSHAGWSRPSTNGHVPLQAGMFLTEAYRLRPQIVRGDGNHKLDNQGWLGRSTAAVSVANTRGIDFIQCRFENNGHTGLDYETGTEGGEVAGCVFRDLGGNGLVVGSFSPPSHETHLPYLPADAREICRYLSIHDNLFTNITNEDWGTVAILAGYVHHVQIEHNEISDLSYTGISLGWGWNQTIGVMHNNRIAANHIHHYGKQMYDVSGIYTLGAQPKTWIINNAIHSIYRPSFVHDVNHWFYLYTDEGSSFLTVKNNWVPTQQFLQNANGPNNLWKNNHPFVNDSVKLQAGIRYERYAYLQDEIPTLSDKRLASVPSYFVIEFSGEQPDRTSIEELAYHNGVHQVQWYRWKNHLLLYAVSNQKQVFYDLVTNTYPNLTTRLYEEPLYNFNRKEHCGDTGCVTEWDHHIFSANLVDDPEKQEAYVRYHHNQQVEFPGVAKGFCRAQFQQVEVFKNGRQLVLIISIPRGENLDALDQLTTLDNPQTVEWNRIMSQLQTGLSDADPGEVWVKFKKITQLNDSKRR